MDSMTTTSTPAVETEADPQLSCFWSEVAREGRNAAPELLWTRWCSGEMPRETFKGLVPLVWSVAEWPARSLGKRAWLAMFKDAGFVSDCGSPPPEEPVVVYRGAVRSNMRGFSWTTDFERAARFAGREELMGIGDGAVFEVSAPPHVVLAHIVGRSEAEMVLNPSCLRGRATPRAVARETWSEIPYLEA